MGRVRVTYFFALAVLGQPVLGELTDRLEQRVARACGGVLGDDERLAHERVEVAQHVDVVCVLDDGHETGQVEAAGEDGQHAEQGAFVVGEQVVGPPDRVPEGELALGPGRAALQETEAIGEPVSYLDRTHRRHARRSQLDAEREPVDGLTDLGDGRGRLGIVDPKVGPHRTSSIDEQRDRVGRLATVTCEWWDRERDLAADGERLARGGDDPHAARAAEDRRDRGRRRADNVLAVVDHQQQLSAGQRRSDGLDEGNVSLRCDAKRGGDRRWHRVRVAQRRELDQPDPVGELTRDLGTHLERKPRLSDSANAGQRDQPVAPHELGDFADEFFPSDHGAELLRQVSGERVDTAQDREVRPQALGEDLEHRHPAAQTAQPVFTERPEPDAIAQQHLGRVGHEYLAAVGDRHQACGSVDLAAEVVPVTFDRLAGVQAHAHREVDGAVVSEF